MPRTIHCTSCGVALNIPEAGIGKRLKCPKCGNKFHATDPGTKASSSAIGLHDAGPASSQVVAKRGHGDFDLPTAAGDLRETFDIPLLMSDDGPSAKPSSGAADAAILFHDDRPTGPRRLTGAEARAKARRCPTCGGVVAIGMSVCSTCGLDLETGVRIALADELAPPPPQTHSGPHIGVVMIGLVCLLVSIGLTGWAAIQSAGGEAGFIYFVPVGLFAIFASVQFLRLKSAKLLLCALTIGAVLDVIGLVIMPVVIANSEIKKEQRTTVGVDEDELFIQPINERLDMNRMAAGLAVLAVYAAVSVYVMSPPVSRQFRR
jgi:DNA-directed RNA polymerase subunit M/transcription elongation factor TFIIS